MVLAFQATSPIPFEIHQMVAVVGFHDSGFPYCAGFIEAPVFKRFHHLPFADIQILPAVGGGSGILRIFLGKRTESLRRLLPLENSLRTGLLPYKRSVRRARRSPR